MKIRKWILTNSIISLLLIVFDHVYSTVQIGKQMGTDHFIDRLLGIGESTSMYLVSIRLLGLSYFTEMNLHQFLLFSFSCVFLAVSVISLIIGLIRRIANHKKDKNG